MEGLTPNSHAVCGIEVNKDNYLLLFDNEKYNTAPEAEKKYIKTILSQYLGKVDHFNGEKVFTDQSIKSPFFLFIFAVLYLNIKPYKRKEQDRYSKTKEQLIDSIILFVQEYSDGIYELAKNIIEHSERREGMITVRVYRDSKNTVCSLENYVFDFGSKGIIETIKIDTNNLKNKLLPDDIDVRKDLEEDLGIISSGHYSLADFIEPLVDSRSPKRILNQQIRREIAHFGLMQFFNLITSNDGSISAGTANMRNEIEQFYSSRGEEQNSIKSHVLAKGTSYFFQFPPKSIVGREDQETSLDNKEKNISPSEIDSFSSFYDTIENTFIIELNIPQAVCCGREYEQNIINDFTSQLNGADSSKKSIVIDFRKVDATVLSPAGFLRILATLPLKAKGKHIIITNITTKLYLNAIKNNRLYHDKITKNQWWIENDQVLCYTYCEVPNVGYYYYADMLTGKSEKDFVTVNRIIHNTFDNAFTIVDAQNSKDYSGDEDFCCHNPFFTEKALTPFDIEIKAISDKPIFINNLNLILDNEIKRAASPAESFHDENPLIAHVKGKCGYSISDTHFKIGSKFHASRYIYAKRLFNNSYYSSRLALCLARSISQRTDNKNSLTLLGYEQYSLALLSLIKKYLEKWGYASVFAFYASANNGELEINGDFECHGNCIIIVPIVSTGSTSIALVQAANSKLGYKQPISYYYHIIATESGNSIPSANEIMDDGEYEKIIKIISVATGWSQTDDCPDCFGDKRKPSFKAVRKPLLEADKTNLNPLSIFELPSIKEDTNRQKFDLNSFKGDGILNYSLVKTKQNGCYRLYSINTEKFINYNRTKIVDWLNNLKIEFQRHIDEDMCIHPADHIVILSPSSDTNASFINMVNEYTFGSSATILYLQADEEYLENFKLLNGDLFKNTNSTKVFFVDDELVSASSFFKIYDLFRFTTGYNHDIRLLGSIFLLNKASKQIDVRVKRASSNHLFAYMDINDQLLFELSGLPPLSSESRKYETLASYSLNINSRLFFQKKALAFNPKINVKGDNSKGAETLKGERHLSMFEITHKLYYYFGTLNDDGKHRFKSITSIDELCIAVGLDAAKKYELIKVLCNHPFIMYYDILCKTFELHNKMLIDEISDIDSLTDTKIEHILFLIRRAVLIKNYIIITSEFFGKLSVLFDALEPRTENQSEKDLFSLNGDYSGVAY